MIFCFGTLGGICTAFIATLGPQTGMRTMIITRYSSGYVGGAIYSVLNILTQYVRLFAAAALALSLPNPSIHSTDSASPRPA